MECEKCAAHNTYIDERKKRAIARLEGILDKETTNGFVGSFDGANIDETFTKKSLLGMIAYAAKEREFIASSMLYGGQK